MQAIPITYAKTILPWVVKSTLWHQNALAFFVGLAVFLSASVVSAQSTPLPAPILLDVKKLSMPIAPQAVMMADPKNAVSARLLRDTKGEGLQAKPINDPAIKLGVSGYKHWAAFTVINDQAQTQWFLDLGQKNDGRNGQLTYAKIYKMPLAHNGAEPPFFF